MRWVQTRSLGFSSRRSWTRAAPLRLLTAAAASLTFRHPGQGRITALHVEAPVTGITKEHVVLATQQTAAGSERSLQTKQQERPPPPPCGASGPRPSGPSAGSLTAFLP